MGRALCSVGARLDSPKLVVVCPWNRKRRRQKVASLRRLTNHATPEEPVFFAGEMDVHLNPKMGRGWMLPGHRRLVVTPGKDRKHDGAGALTAATEKLTVVDAPSEASELFCELVWRLVTEYRGTRRIHVILDNYGIHSSTKTQRFVTARRSTC